MLLFSSSTSRQFFFRGRTCRRNLGAEVFFAAKVRAAEASLFSLFPYFFRKYQASVPGEMPRPAGENAGRRDERARGSRALRMGQPNRASAK
jgi:hypothetical protein